MTDCYSCLFLRTPSIFAGLNNTFDLLTMAQINITELPLEYQKEVAEQIIFISAFLGGFSASILGTLITSKSDSKVLKALIVSSSLSAISFIVAVFAMTSIIMISTKGYPFIIDVNKTTFIRLVGTASFMVGLLALIIVVAMSGWMHSKRVGWITAVLGMIGLVLILLST